MPNIVLCADDYAISPGVSGGIIKLARKERISAISCMAASSYWPVAAKQLQPLLGFVDIGIHITLTDQAPIGTLPNIAKSHKLPSFGQLLRKCLFGRICLSEVKEEVQNQLDSFVKNVGQLPTFVDGHHHVHQLPGIREIIVETILDNYAYEKPYLRICSAPVSVILKRKVEIPRSIGIGLFGNKLAQLAKKNNIPITSRFSGVYDFSNRAPYSYLFQQFHVGLTDCSLIMCHPGKIDAALVKLDKLTTQRQHELTFFESHDFDAILKKTNTYIKRFRDC